MADSQYDIWAQWLLKRRFGGDPARMKMVIDRLYPVRDKVLSHVNLKDNGTLLDVGCGDGLIGFGALEKSKNCHVIFSDISEDLLNHADALAQEMNLRDRCQFVRASADDLSMFEDETIDAVTTRSVLIYVSAKQKAFDEFHRVLKKGGQLSIFEPINRFAIPDFEERFGGYDVTPIAAITRKVEAVYQRIQPLDSDPMMDFDERDLIRQVEKAGFSEVYLELRAEIKPAEVMEWSVFLSIAGNPKIPTIAEVMEQELTPEEGDRFTAHLRPLVESGQGTRRMAVAYLWAVK
jgi:ubiquinone/menaquinone biosynthesis C-methylase UbiE